MPTQSASAALPPRRRRWRFPDPRIASEVVLWICVFFVVVAVPVVVAMMPVEGVTKPRGVWRDFASALGYVGVSMIGVLFVLSARIPRATAQFGIDVVFHFHRWIALLAIAVLLAHVGIVLALGRPEDVPSIAALLERPALVGGSLALLLFVVMVGWSLARKPLADRPPPKHWASEYDTWRWGHALLATVAYLLLLWHVVDRAPSLDAGWKKLFWFLYAVVGLALIAWIRLVRPTARSNRRWRVEEVRQEAPKVWTVRLKAFSRTPLVFLPGQFVWLTMRANRYAMREHPFSIASAAHPRQRHDRTDDQRTWQLHRNHRLARARRDRLDRRTFRPVHADEAAQGRRLPPRRQRHRHRTGDVDAANRRRRAAVTAQAPRALLLHAAGQADSLRDELDRRRGR